MIGFVRGLAERCDLLGIELAPLAVLALDTMLVVFVSGRVVVRLERGRRWGPSRRLLASGLVGLSVIVGSVTALGAAGQLSSVHLLLAHAALALLVGRDGRDRSSSGRRAGLVAAVVLPLAAVLAPWRALFDRTAWRRGGRAEAVVLAAILAVLVFYLVLAVFTLPLNYDSNTYRLSRVGLWLQNGDVYHLETNDPRQNFTGQNADFAMLWLVSFFHRGYPLVGLVQFLAGVLACAAVWEMGAQLGMTRRYRLAGVAVLLGTPTASLQFFTSQTDLFGAGCLAAAMAFLLPALRERRAAYWILVGVGGGLALGTKATLLYWVPGLAVVGLGWAWRERCPPLATARGLALAAAVALPLFAFNALLNQWEFSQPVAPATVVARTLAPAQVSRADWRLGNLLVLGWQLVEPESNPWLPRAVSEAWSSAMAARLVATRPGDEVFASEIERGATWFSHGLSEDYASFGLLVALLGVGGGAMAGRRLFDPRLRQVASEVGLLALGVAAYVVVACLYQTMTTLHQFRYFCFVAPATAVVAAYGLSGVAGRAGRALAFVVVAAQLATAVYVGVESRHHGWRALLRPQSAPNFPLWAEGRNAIEELGARPLRVGVALPRDSWLAPLLRSGVKHRIDLVTWADFANGRCLSRVLEQQGSEALITSQWMLASLLAVDVPAVPVPGPQANGLLVARPGASDAAPSPPSVRATGILGDGWSRPHAVFEVSGCSGGRFALAVHNASPLDRRVTARSGSRSTSLDLAPGAREVLAVDVLAGDRVQLDVEPAFVPALVAATTDARELGVRLALPAATVVTGIDGDGWTRPEARLRVEGWYPGDLALEVANPTPLARWVSVRSGAGQVSSEIAPGGTQLLTVPVHFADTVTLAVRPAYVPSVADPSSADARPLGVLLSREWRERLGLVR